jgi:ketosteroid isomerase-like protein
MTESNVAAEISKLGQRWAHAELHGDAAGLDDLLAADFTGVGPRGFILTRNQWLQRYLSGDLKNTKFSWGDTTVRGYGDVAVAIGVQDQVAEYNSHPASGRFRVTLVAIRQQGNWRIASVHISGPLMTPDAPGGE